MKPIQFDQETHTYRDGDTGRLVPSVTQVLEVLSDFSKVPWQRLEAARERGSLVHAAGELLIKGQLAWDSIDSEIQAYMLGLQKFLAESGAVITGTERIVYNRELGYAGTLDAIAHWRNGYALLDWKTSVVTPISVGPQLYGYEAALKQHTGQWIRRHYCVRLMPNDYRVDRVDNIRNRSVFISALNIWKYRHECNRP